MLVYWISIQALNIGILDKYTGFECWYTGYIYFKAIVSHFIMECLRGVESP